MQDKWQKATIIKAWNQTPDFKSLILKPEKLHSFYSGNFVELATQQNGPYKCYSVVSAPSYDPTIEVGVKLYEKGELSPKLFRLNVGDKILMRGPMGAGFIWEPSDRNTVMIAGGAGICPMVSILRQHRPAAGKLSLLFSARTGSTYYEKELKELTTEKNVELLVRNTTEESRVDKKFIVEMFADKIKPTTDFFVAGPTEFVQNISYWLRQLGISEDNLKTDDFAVT